MESNRKEDENVNMSEEPSEIDEINVLEKIIEVNGFSLKLLGNRK
jgi:hypothetical protein